jgi:tRNA-modifying protein YgfZ
MASAFSILPHRAILALTGPDTITLLERLVTNATDDWSDGETRYGALLTPQGKVIADYLAIRTPHGVLLDVSQDHLADLEKRLKMFRLRSEVEIAPLPDMQVIAALDSSALETANAQIERIYTDPRYPGGRQRGLIAQQPLPAARPISEYHTDRIANGVPEQGFDFAQADVFPADINMDILSGVALNKGCFVGQEVVSRMHRRGKIRKRSLTVTLPDAITAGSGDDLMAPAPIGALTSCQDKIALARIRIDRWLAADHDGHAVTLHETPVIIEKPDWLLVE